MTLNIAHRGNSGECPENTVAAFLSAVEIGVDMIELDVWWTQDRELVVMHDATVDRCTDGTGAISEMTLAQIKALDAGSWMDQRFAAEQVPTLAEAFAVIPHPVGINMHLKTVTPEPAFVRQVHRTAVEADVLTRLLVVHDDLPTLQRFRTLDDTPDFCLLPPTGDGNEYIAVAEQHGFRVLQPGRGMMCVEFCRAVQAHGMRANVFYADTAEDMRQYIAWGIDGILTNYPARLKRVLAGA